MEGGIIYNLSTYAIYNWYTYIFDVLFIHWWNIANMEPMCYDTINILWQMLTKMWACE